MAYDLKSATPDTTIAASSFLFGADSQAASAPSVFAIADVITYIGGAFARKVTVTQGTANEGVIASTGYSLTGANAQSMVDLAGTWNTSGTPTALKLNITNTASNAASLLADLQAGGTSMFKVRVDGRTTINGMVISNVQGFWAAADAAAFMLGAAQDLWLVRDGAANILAQRNGANAQTFRVYNTYTDASNYERGVFNWSTTSNVLTIGTSKAGTGSTRNLQFIVGDAVKADYGITTAATWTFADAIITPDLRINKTFTFGAVAQTHYFILNINGTDFKIMCGT